MNGLVSGDALLQLGKINYTTHFAVIVFLGWQPTGHEGVCIERLIRTDNRISIFAQSGRQLGSDMVTSPYHLIKATKTGHWDAAMTFNLALNGTIVVKSQYIP